MDANGILQKHWMAVASRFALDAVIFVLAFVLGTYHRLGDESTIWLMSYWPGILIGSMVFACACYTFGLYSPQNANQEMFKRSLTLAFCVSVAIALMLGIFYLKFSTRIGRGVMLRSGAITYLGVFIHHALLVRRLRFYRERVAFIVTSVFDESETGMFEALGSRNLELVGLVTDNDYQPRGTMKVLGRVQDLPTIVERENLVRVLCTNTSIKDPTLYRHFCQLRYSGIPVMPLIGLCEEVYQCVPLELVSPEWLLNASGSPHLLYIKKIKRGFDIAVALAGIFFLGPALLFGMVLVRLTSPGSIIYRQTRGGRFGQPFEMFKLRTMGVDAEKDGAVWSPQNDPRVTPVGRFLRKYRIDEIPQLFNVLRGEMSFVGPRPERPEFFNELARQVPLFQERLMVQPGITGWAQVNYPYGATVDDTRRKLEFDLYYMKNMSLFLDLFILLDTVRIILRGGLDEASKKNAPHYAAIQEWGRRRDKLPVDDALANR